MKNQLLLFVTCIFMVIMVSGCVRVEQDYVIGEDNHVRIAINQSINLETFAEAYVANAEKFGVEEKLSKEEVIAMVKEGASADTYQVVDGYIVYPEEVSEYDEKDMVSNMPMLIANKDKFVMGGNGSLNTTDSSSAELLKQYNFSAEDLEGMVEYCKVTVTFPKAVTVTNGTKADDNTVFWDTSKNKETQVIYAYTVPVEEGTIDNIVASDVATIEKQIKESVKDVTENVKDTKKPVFSGVKNNKSYKKQITIYVKDDTSIKNVKVNGKNVKLSKVKKGKYKGYYKFTLKKKGSYKIVASDTAGNKKSIKIKIKK